MEFDWSEEQLARKKAAADFAATSLDNDGVVARDRQGAFSAENWERCADFGLLGMSVPDDYGGRALDLQTGMLVMEGFGYGCRDNGLAFALNAQLWTVQLPIVEFGTEEQKRKFLPGLCSGSLIGAHALSEPESGSDAFSLRMVATRQDGGYVLNGVKHLISLAPVADLALVFALTDPDAGKWGISAFLVEVDTPGLTSTLR